MFFDKSDIELSSGTEVIDANVFIERVTDAIKKKYAFVPDYSYGEKVTKEDAEEFMFELYSILKS